jgi:alpha-aminoadipate carrier protein LysW
VPYSNGDESPTTNGFYYQRAKEIRIMATEMLTECPECAAEIELVEDTIVHEIVVCPDCGVELEVIDLDPPTVDRAPEEEEDWGE